jgi:hypothetical protein
MPIQQSSRNYKPLDWETITLAKLSSERKHSIKRGPWGGSLKKDIFVNSGYKVYEQKNVIHENFNLGNYYVDDRKFAELKDFEIFPGDIFWKAIFWKDCNSTTGYRKRNTESSSS